MASETERGAMRRAISASAALLGTTNPNPCVGAVVVDAMGEVAAVGVTRPVGGEHAEVVALRDAGARAAAGTLVVTLEPCVHTGRTAPCTEAILAAGVRRVVYALADPHPTAAGGARRLREAGVEVEGDVLAGEAAEVLGRWTAAVARGRPHLTWKYAATLDGRTAAADGSSRWITGTAARRDVHRERYLVDAVVVGIETVLADDSRLDVRDWPATRQPTRVVVDTEARTPPGARVLDASATSVVAVADDADPSRTEALRAVGAEILPLPRRDGHVDLLALLQQLASRETYTVLVEGGATLAAGFLRRGLVDRLVGYHAPLLLGAGKPVVGDLGILALADADRLTIDDVSLLGGDVRIEARVETVLG